MSERITGQKLRSPHNVDASASTASLAGVGHGPGGWSVLSGFATLHRWSWAVTVARIMHGTVIGVYFILWCDVRCTRTRHVLARRSDERVDHRVSIRSRTRTSGSVRIVRILTHEFGGHRVERSNRQTY